MSPNRKKHNAIQRETFLKVGHALSNLEKDWAVRKAEYQYEIKPVAVADPLLSSKLFGPQLRTQQFKATVYLDAAK